jgi:ribosomal protein S24E
MPMKLEILSEKENKPLARKEIEFRIEHVGGTTPSRADVLAKIVAQFDADTSRVVIRALNTRYGIGISEGSARIYDTAEQMERVELAHIVKRQQTEEKKE